MSPARRDFALLGLMSCLFLAWHVPLMYRLPAGQDEDFYAIPGIMVARSGIPSIPYLPSRDPHSICFHADEALFTLPPLGFYWQGLIHLAFGEGLGQARLASAIAGLAAMVLVYVLSRQWFQDRTGALFAAALFLFGRPCTFAATTARPDMLTTALALGSIACAERFRLGGKLPWIPLSGFLGGLSLLSHPFGLVAILGVGGALVVHSIRKSPSPLALYLPAAAFALSLWLPFALSYPELFRVQFGANVLLRAGPGLSRTLLAPWTILSYQSLRLWHYLMPAQAVVLLMGLAALAFQSRTYPTARVPLYYAGCSLILMMLLLGRHPALQYYVYPVALASVATGQLASGAVHFLAAKAASISPRMNVLPHLLACGLLILLWLPGSGVRTLEAHLRHWRDPNYNAHLFAQDILQDLPAQSLVAVDGPYVLDFFLADRPVIQALVYPFYFDARSFPFQYVLVGPDGLRQVRPLMEQLVLLRTYRPQGQPFANRAFLYVRTHLPSVTPPADH